MTRIRTTYVCRGCGARAARWAGRCHGCGEWNTLVETAASACSSRGTPAGTRTRTPVWEAVGGWHAPPSSALLRLYGDDGLLRPLGAVDPDACVPVPTGLEELDRVLSGGLVPGSVTLVGGEPGIGKSTLLLQAAASAAACGRRTLLVAGEESAEQVRRRAERTASLVDDCYIIATADLPAALEAVGTLSPELLVVDSIQTIGDPALVSAAGSTAQVRECAQAFVHLAKATGTATVLVGHVTKDGTLAGPRALEHLVDTVLSFEGDRHHSLRHLHATKHRYGTTGEIGLFEMTASGLAGLADPSAVLLADRRPGAAGAAVAPVLEGRRSLLVEVQALVGEKRSSSPRRVVQGIAPGRLGLLLAVLERSVHLPLSAHDVFVSTTGGIKVSEPGADLAVALSLVSAYSGVPVGDTVVAFGEVGLDGTLRQTSGPDRRLSEAKRLGFDLAVAPASLPSPGGTMELVQAATIAEAVSTLGLADVRRAARRPVGGRAPGGEVEDVAAGAEGVGGRSARRDRLPPMANPRTDRGVVEGSAAGGSGSNEVEKARIPPYPGN